MAAGDRRRTAPNTVIAVGGLTDSELRATAVPVSDGSVADSVSSTAVSEQSPPTSLSVQLAILQTMEIQTGLLIEIRNLLCMQTDAEPGDLAEEGVPH